jgi:WD40 repeat protein
MADSPGLRRNVLLQPPAWAPNVDVELELSGAEDPCEVLDFGQAIKSVAFSGDGSCLASGCQDGFVRTIRCDTEERNLALSMALDPRFSAGDSGLGLLDSDLLKYIISLIPFEPLRLGGNVARDNLESGGKALVSAIAFAPDDASLASATITGRIIFFETRSYQPLGCEICCGASHSIMALAYISNAVLASAGRDRVIRIWAISTGAQVSLPLEGHTGLIHTLSSCTPSGENAILASGASDCSVRLWNLEIEQDDCGAVANVVGREFAQPLKGHYRGIHCAVFCPEGKMLAVASGDSLISMWDVDGEPAHRGEPLKGHLSSVFCLAFSPNGQVLASGGDDRIIRMWCCR